MELRRRVPVLSRAIARGAGLALALAAASALPARAVVTLSPAEAVALAFPRARCERVPLALDAAQLRSVQQRARARLHSRHVTAWVAWRGDTLAGIAFLDQRTVRTMPATILTAIRSDTTIGRVEILAFHEPQDYRPPVRWLARFPGRRLDERLWPRRDVPNLAGATLSARALTESVRVGLALYAEIGAELRRRTEERP